MVWDHQAAGSIPVTRTKILTESRVYSPLLVIFYAYLGVLPPLLEKSYPHDHIIKCGPEISFSLFTAAQNLKSQTSNRHRFSCGGVGFTLRRSSRFKPFFFCGDFGILLFNHLCKLFFAFFSCVGVDIELFAFAVRQFRRIAAFPFLFADSKYAPRSGRRIFGCFGSNFALTGVSGALSGVCPSSPKAPSFLPKPRSILSAAERCILSVIWV